MQSFRTNTERSIKKDTVTAKDLGTDEDLNNLILCQMTRIFARRFNLFLDVSKFQVSLRDSYPTL